MVKQKIKIKIKAYLAFLQYQKTGYSLFYDEQAMISLQEMAEFKFFIGLLCGYICLKEGYSLDRIKMNKPG